MCWIIKAPVMPVHLARKHRTCLIRIAAYGDHGLHLLVEEFAEVLGVMCGDVDADFLHHLDGERMDVTRGLRTGTGHAETSFRHGAEHPLGEMAATGIARAKHQDEGK